MIVLLKARASAMKMLSVQVYPKSATNPTPITVVKIA